MQLGDFITMQVGPNWCVALHAGPRIRAKYDHVISPKRYEALEEQWAARFPDEFRRQFEAVHSRDLRLLRAAGLWPLAPTKIRRAA